MELIYTPIEMYHNKEKIAYEIFSNHVKINSHMKMLEQKYLEDTIYTIRYLVNALEVDEINVFSSYMKWFGKLAYHLRFRIESMEEHIHVMLTFFEDHLDQVLSQKVQEFIKQGFNSFQQSYHSVKLEIFNIDVFLQYLIDMESNKAYQYILDEMNRGLSLKEVYLNLLQPTLYQVGELWQQRQISVAKEHYITAAIQNIIGKLYSILFSIKQPNSFSVTAVCAGNELHEIGMRMVADIFELHGWDSIFLGSNIPIDMVINQLMEHPTNLLAISATNSSHLIDVKQLIAQVKSNNQINHIKILVGGRAFNESPTLWKKIGADGYASDAEQAVMLGNLLIGGTMDESNH